MSKFVDISGQGCGFCHEPVWFTQPGLTVFELDEIILCPTCSGYTGKETTLPATKIFVPNIDQYM